jgi:hypothetical protein
MQAFAFRNALILDADFHHHADRLVAGIRQLLQNVPAKQTITRKKLKRSETVERAEEALPGTKPGDRANREISAPAEVDFLPHRKESIAKEAVWTFMLLTLFAQSLSGGVVPLKRRQI